MRSLHMHVLLHISFSRSFYDRSFAKRERSDPASKHRVRSRCRNIVPNNCTVQEKFVSIGFLFSRGDPSLPV